MKNVVELASTGGGLGGDIKWLKRIRPIAKDEVVDEKYQTDENPHDWVEVE